MTDTFDEEEFTSQINRHTLMRILAQLKPHWKWVAVMMTANVVVSFTDSYFGFLRKGIIDDGIASGNHAALLRVFAVYTATMLIQALSVFWLIYFTAMLGERVQYDLRKKMFTHLQNLSFSYFDRTPVGWIMSRLTSDPTRIAELVTWGLLDSSWGALSIITSLGFMLIINWRLALIVVAIVPVLLFVAAYFKPKIIVEYRQVRKINSKITGAYNENITGVRVVKALCREEENLREFGELTDDMYRAGFRAAWLSALFLPAVQIISAAALGAIIWYGGAQVQ